jgi:glycosyltransferase involved in cell wall biosynthesis
MTLVSVIVPAHNAEETVEACVCSVISQSHRALELIVVDDASTDKTAELVARVKDCRITLVSTTYRSAAAARNAGLRIAKGDYIQFLDADDQLALNKLEVQLRRLGKQLPSTMASCPWGHFSIRTDDVLLKSQRIDRDIAPVDWLVESWNGRGMAQTACWLTPRRLIDLAGGWNEELKQNPNDDGEFFCRVLLNAGLVVFTADTCVYYRKPGAGCVSRVESEAQSNSLLLSYVEYEKHLRQVEDSPRTRGAIAQNYYRYIYQYHQQYPHLCEHARNRLGAIGWPKCTSVGPLGFRLSTWVFGFERAMRIRAAKYRWLSPR